MSGGLKSTSFEDIVNHLKGLGICESANVIVHSKLFAFGRIDSENPVKCIYDALRSAIGETGTIACPTYVFSTDYNHVFDPASSPAETGALSEYIRKLPGAIRTSSPIHSHAAIGPLAVHFLRSDPGTSIGPGSDFEKLRDLDFRLLLLGCKFSEGATYLHHLEAMHEVPYRKWITLKKKVKSDNHQNGMEIPVRYFARANEDHVEDFDPVGEHLREQGLLETKNAPYGKSASIPIQTLDKQVGKMLDANPYALVKRK